eukprot:TRINITY_DN6928_c0_g2_i1.p1 TRINITY_DN6928_c0_g2~~TRINITY_DN6928_c0_g2_i1.p1  ORF type:complete len:273 (+),score=62.08 TRINITY_DN6928_c0_g2_i1:108-821(+)
MVLAEGAKGFKTETVNFLGRADSDSDETESVSPGVLFSHKLSDASTTAGPELVAAAPAVKVAEALGTSKGKRKSRPANAKGKQGPISGLRSELRAQGQQIMKDLLMPVKASKRQTPVPAKMVPCQRPVARPVGKLSPPPGLAPPPGLEVTPVLGYDSGFSGCGGFGPQARGTDGNDQVFMGMHQIQDGSAMPTSADASYFDEELFGKSMLQHLNEAHWQMLQNEAEEEMLVLGRWSL